LAGKDSNTTFIEYIYGFQNSDFQAYMDNPHPEPTWLMRQSEQMSRSDHPLVKYAAGWAAAEFALFRPRGCEFSQPLPARLEALEAAQAQWVQASKGMPAMREAQILPEKVMAVRGLEVRVVQALATLTTMEVGASWFAGDPMNPEETKAKTEQTASQLTALGGVIGSWPRHDSLWRTHKSGVAGEVLLGLIGQDTGYAAIPASYRRDHDPKLAKRADYVVISPEPNHPRALVQLGSKTKQYEYTLNLNPPAELTLGKGKLVYHTLEAFAQREAGTASQETLTALGSVTQRLTVRLDRYMEHLG
jgi:hypothetical protein